MSIISVGGQKGGLGSDGTRNRRMGRLQNNMTCLIWGNCWSSLSLCVIAFADIY